MKVSTPQMIPMIAMLTVLVIGFQNCGQTRFTQEDGEMSLKAVDENGNLVPMGDTTDIVDTEVPAVQNPAPVVTMPPVQTVDVVVSPVPSPTPKVVVPGVQEPPKPRDVASEDDDKVVESKDDGRSGPCAAFKSVAMPLAIDAAAPDLTSRNTIGPLEFDFAKDLIVENHHGPLLVKSAASVQVSNVTGQVRIAANLVNGTNIGGNACVLADKVGSITNIGGGSYIVAREVESVQNSNGNVHIFGARVQKIANHRGKICLHDGAVVLEVVNAQVGKCD